MKKLLLILAFITFSAQAQLSQSFEGGTTTPAGWTVISGGDTNTWAVTDLAASTGLQAENGTKIFSILYGATAHDDYLVTPQFDVIPGVADKLTFWARSRDAAYPEVIDVVLSTTTATAGAFTNVLQANIAPVSGTNFYKYTIDLSAFPSQPVYIGFHSTTTDKFAFDIDNVVVGATPSCYEVTTPAVVSNATASSVSIAWTAAVPAPANGYDIFYSIDNMAPTASTTPNFSVGAGVTTANLTGLTPSTKYYLYIRSNCGGSSSVWGYLTVFNSFVDPIPLPYASGFDNATQLAGWTTSGTVAANTFLGTTAANAQSPAQYWVFNTSVTPVAANNLWLYCRPISLTAGETVTATFWYRTAIARNLRFTVGASNTAAAQTTVIYSNATLPIATAYTQLTMPNFVAPTTSVYYFAFNDLSASTATASSMRIDTVNLSSVLGVKDFLASKIAVLPNPAKDFVAITNNSDAVVSNVEMADLNGRIIKSIKVNASESQISVSDLATGVYMMKITTDQGTVTKKIVKE